MSTAIQQTYEGVKNYVGDLVDAHRDTAEALSSNANNYISADHLNAKKIKELQGQAQRGIRSALNSNSATVIEYGGSDDPVLPKQDQVYASLLA